MKTSAEIRNDFIEFFKSKEHTFVRSAPVAPQDDPTLMFTNAGMNQFKSIFLGENPKGLKRAANSQKCMRVSGKHNDLEEVGVDHYHHTLFEMLGNWSFGDYYKKEAISWAWELLTDVWGLPKDKLYATVYKTDDESFDLWKNLTDIKPEHITRHGDKDNFWEMGETGPCGPCTEIHIDLGEGICPHETEADHVCEVNGDNCHRYLEIWNNVFMQNNRLKDGSLEDLPAKHVDTGMGLERVVRIIQNAKSNYDTDLFMPIIKKLEQLSGKTYDRGTDGIPFRVIADHMRALTIAITDGVFPSNEGRGYVLRRLLRRAYRYGRKLGFNQPFMYTLVDSVIEILGGAFPEITERREFVISVIKGEEERFDASLETGIEKFNHMADAAKAAGKTEISGADLFSLYDTYGFPVDLTRLMAEEIGFTVDEAGFEIEMDAQRARARKARSEGNDDGLTADGWTDLASGEGTEFLGYETTSAEVTVSRYKILDENHALVILGKTPFYAEMGGQVGDTGTLICCGITSTVTDTINWNGMAVHKLHSDVEFTPNYFKGTFTATVNVDRQNKIRRNHSATHLLQAALIAVLGDHVSQSGSRVDENSLRFDFTHFAGVSDEELTQVEDLVNSWVSANTCIATAEMDVDAAKAAGAKALFGEKYGDSVRVVTMNDNSKELCGGLHASRTGDIGAIVITSESSVSAGVRRIEAVCGSEAIKLFRANKGILRQVSSQLNVAMGGIAERVGDLKIKIKDLESELKKVHAAAAGAQSDEIIGLASKNVIGSVGIAVENLGSMDKETFANLFNAIGDSIKQKNLKAAVVLAAEIDGAVSLAAVASKDAGVHCGDLVKIGAAKVEGTGGGSPVRAQAGGKVPANIPAAIEAIKEAIAAKLA